MGGETKNKFDKAIGLVHFLGPYHSGYNRMSIKDHQALCLGIYILGFTFIGISLLLVITG